MLMRTSLAMSVIVGVFQGLSRTQQGSNLWSWYHLWPTTVVEGLKLFQASVVQCAVTHRVVQLKWAKSGQVSSKLTYW